MDPATKQFYKLQYRWKRLPHPEWRAAINERHPLHQIELEIAHSIHEVYRVIQDVLEGTGQSTYEDALQVVEHFTRIRFALELAKASSTVENYRHFVDETLELLKSGADILRPFPPEP